MNWYRDSFTISRTILNWFRPDLADTKSTSLVSFNESIITVRAQARRDSNNPRRAKVHFHFLWQFDKELINLSLFSCRKVTVSPLPLWIHKSIYVFHKWCTSRSLKCSVRQNTNLAHWGGADSKLIGALNRTACSRTVRVCLTKDVVSESTASVEMATDLHCV